MDNFASANNDLTNQVPETNTMDEMVQDMNKARRMAEQKQGLTAISIGALMLLGSCLLTFAVPSTHDSFELVLYGVPCLGVGIVFYGLVKIFG